MDGKRYSLEEILRITVNQLEEINVPVRYADQIGHPLSLCINNLSMCIIAIENAKNKEEKVIEDGTD